MNEHTDCPRCGGTPAPDGRCWECGADLSDLLGHTRADAGADGAAGYGERGPGRRLNADALALRTTGPWTVGAVCDGVSMAPRAERAARIAAEVTVQTLARALAAGAIPEDALTDATARAGRAVAALAAPGGPRPDPLVPGSLAPSCTQVACVVGEHGLWVSWVGDSRAYWLPDTGTGMLLTEDDTGEHDALVAWLGADAADPVPRIRSHRPPCPGRLLLCTDGLWRHLPDPDDLRTAAATADAAETARTLVRHVLDAGGRDDATALLVPVRGRPPAETGGAPPVT
ncbi:PP2C family serine/threonine-protein phosphatase [Nocardiopsis sp. CC223A]|uniref:PP2C family protein-serine/threonine phosphatase n=1 Tax=Nocardiopsis sp. CC223A TaxID=3044051 RepID=UPI00278C0FA4|nr:protein phosphatase 2C domain-containing protein [Nocardiopsis sp. CC223A]